MKTTLLLSTLILLILTTQTTATQHQSIIFQQTKDTLYVGGTGPNNYTRIQDAVNDATTGDTVYVYAGIYTDHNLTNHATIFISTSITLQGENKTTTILDGSFEKSIIQIATNNVTIQGFTIQNSGRYAASPPPSAIYLNPGGPTILQNIKISHALIQHNWVGIGMQRTLNITIHHNQISHNKWGLSLIDTEDTISFHHNHITDNEIGIFLSFGGPTTITNNTFQHNQDGISANDCQATITGNNFQSNHRHARFAVQMQFLDIFRRSWHNHWEHNYWDNWKTTTPKPILGSLALYIALLFFPAPMIIPLGQYPLIRFDAQPTPNPHDI